MKILKSFAFTLMALLCSVAFTACSDDDDNKDLSGASAIIGTWGLESTYTGDAVSETIKMTITFRADHTGSIVEEWITSTKASGIETYSMDFSWSTTSDASGNDIMRISYVKGDKNTEIFGGDENTVLWTRQYVLTGNILNIYQGSGVWVFNRK